MCGLEFRVLGVHGFRGLLDFAVRLYAVMGVPNLIFVVVCYWLLVHMHTDISIYIYIYVYIYIYIHV